MNQVVGALLLVARLASAAPDSTDPTANAPLPGEQSGRVDDGDRGASAGLRAGRAALFLPRVLLRVALAPLDGGLYLYDRYQLQDWYYRIFYYRERTLGVIPTGTYVTGLGLTLGARFFDTNLFGDHEQVSLQATAGGHYREELLASVDSGDRLGRLKLSVDGNFDRRPVEPFYGIGNEGQLRRPDQHEIDAFTDDTAIESYFRYQEERGAVSAVVAATPHLHVGLNGSVIQLRYAHDTHQYPSIDQIYATDSLVGFGTTTDRVYGELELTWDSRSAASVWEPSTVHGRGTYADLYGGISQPFDDHDDDVAFWHYGLDLQQYVHLGVGPRVLLFRYHGEAVTGAIDQVPLTELPMLGGAWFLRGYKYARFRDRIAMQATVQYMWSLTNNTSAFVFTDVGRVYRSWRDFTVDDLHAGFGIGLDVYTSPNFVADIAIATTTDGGVSLIAEFSPILDKWRRWR